MSVHRRQSVVISVCGLLLTCILLSTLFSAPVRAGAAQPIFPGASSIQPGEKTPIQMMKQVVTITIRPGTEADNGLLNLNTEIYRFSSPVWFQAIAEVEAVFTMKNPTSQAVSSTVWFPLASALENVDWKLNPGENPLRIQQILAVVGRNPIGFTLKELPNPQGADKLPLPWASFPATFPAEAETVISVSYKLPLQPVRRVLAFYHIFHTAAGWAGAIGSTELILNLPYPASVETIAGIPAGGLRLPPYSFPWMQADLPINYRLEGNQVRFLWTDLEPDAQDDFAVWLRTPATWQELETARAAVLAKPQDGRAWLTLASTYYSQLGLDFNDLFIFNPTMLSAGLAAYQKAADLLPYHPAPHAGLGLLTLAPYIKDRNAPSDVIQSVQAELKIAKALEARYPAWTKDAGNSRWLLSRLSSAVEAYFMNQATAEILSATQEVAEQTRRAVIHETYSARPTSQFTLTAKPSGTPTRTTTPTVTLTPTALPTRTFTPTARPTETLVPTATPVPSAAPSPAATTPLETAPTAGIGWGWLILAAGGGVGLGVVGSLAWQKLRRRNR